MAITLLDLQEVSSLNDTDKILIGQSDLDRSTQLTELIDFIRNKNLNFAGDITVSGNLVVNGTSTEVNTTELTITDNKIVLNKSQVGTPAPTLSSGIEVERGDLNNYQFMFRESDDTFVIGEAASLQAVATREDSPTANSIPYWDDSLKRYSSSSVTVSGNTITGTSSKSNNLTGGNATTLRGSIPYQVSTDNTALLSPNTTTTKKFLSQTGDGTNGVAPAWTTLAASDVGLGNVTNESKATMFTNPTFTGTITGTLNGTAYKVRTAAPGSPADGDVWIG